MEADLKKEISYVDEVDQREMKARDDFVPEHHVSYIGSWGDGSFTAYSGVVLDHGDMWHFATQYKYVSKLANVVNEEGKCLVGHEAKKMERCLELGCDWGHCFCVFENFFEEVYGIEAMESTASDGKENHGRNITRGIMEETPYDDCFFDVVMSNHVLEHSRSAEEVLLELYKITKYGGWSVHTLPCRVDKEVEVESEIHKCNQDYQAWLDDFIHYGFVIKHSYFSWNHNQEEFNIIAQKPLQEEIQI